MLYINIIKKNEIPKSREILKFFHFNSDVLTIEDSIDLWDSTAKHEKRIYLGKNESSEDVSYKISALINLGFEISDIEIIPLDIKEDFLVTLNTNTQILHIDISNIKLYYQRFVSLPSSEFYDFKYNKSDVNTVINKSFSGNIDSIYINQDNISKDEENDNIVAKIYRDSNYSNSKIAIGFIQNKNKFILSFYQSQIQYISYTDFEIIKKLFKEFMNYLQ